MLGQRVEFRPDFLFNKKRDVCGEKPLKPRVFVRDLTVGERLYMPMVNFPSKALSSSNEYTCQEVYLYILCIYIYNYYNVIILINIVFPYRK